MQSASNMMLFDPDMAQQQMDMMDDMSMSAKEYAEYWTDSLSTDGLDRQSEQFQTVRDNLLNIAEEYQKVAQSSDGAIGDAGAKRSTRLPTRSATRKRAPTCLTTSSAITTQRINCSMRPPPGN